LYDSYLKYSNTGLVLNNLISIPKMPLLHIRMPASRELSLSFSLCLVLYVPYMIKLHTNLDSTYCRDKLWHYYGATISHE